MNSLGIKHISDSVKLDKKYQDAFIIFLPSFIFLFFLTIDPPTNGDTYVYARSISTFEGPLIHYGYYIIGHLFHTILKMLGNTPVKTLGVMSAFFGSLSLSCMYLFSYELTKNRFQSFLGSAILLFSGAFWFYAEHGEVYVPQLFFVLFSAILILYKKPLLSSCAILFAISITPTSCLALPGILCLICMKRLQKRQILFFIMPIIFSAICLLMWDFAKIIEIISWATHSPKMFVNTFSYKALITKIVYQLVKTYGKSFNLFSLLALWGFALIFFKERKIWFLMLSFMLPFALYLFNLWLISGDHLIITFIVISFLGSYGLSGLFNFLAASDNAKHIISFCLLAVHFLLSYQLFISPEIRNSLELKKVVHNLERKFKSNTVMLSNFSFGTAFWYLTQTENNHFLFAGRPDKYLQEKYSDMKRLEKAFWVNIGHSPRSIVKKMDLKYLKERPAFFIDRLDWPTRFINLILPESIIEKRKHKIPQIKKIKKHLDKELKQNLHFIKIIDSPLHPVYSVQFANIGRQ